jgi:cold shock CspA family protein
MFWGQVTMMGDEVEFEVSQGAKGLQATNVVVVS